jgi:heme o synthase
MQKPSTHRPATWQCYLNLCKSNVVIEMIFTSTVGMLLAVPLFPPWSALIYGNLGIALAAASAAAINHYVDRDIDKKLNPHRPIPMGYLTPQQVIQFAAVVGVLAMLILLILVNTLTAVLTLLSMFGYAIIYTQYLKRMTSQNIVIGGAFGATPPLLGWCAVTGSIHPHAILLVLIIFVWTPPHFWPLSIARLEKYQQIFLDHKIPMLPVTHGVDHTRLHILLYSILLLIVTVLPYLTHMSGLIYLAIAVPMGLGFIYYALLMMRNKDAKTAMTTFWYSIVYITVLFAALLIDHYFRITL